MMTHLSKNDLALKLEEALKQVEVGALYFHYSNSDQPYKVLAVAFLEASQEPCVVYQKQDGSDLIQSLIWVRPIDIWIQEVFFEGKRVPRFKKVEEKICQGD